MVREETGLSSIALLQERFRQLQRMKELRQERELMRSSLSESSAARASPPHCQLALSLWPDSHATSKPYHSPTPTCHFPQFYLDNSDTDIDTSLRL